MKNVYESLWPLFVIIIIYFIFLGIFIIVREETFLDEKAFLSWMISLFSTTVYFDLFIVAFIALEAIAFLGTFIVVHKVKEERDYAIVYGILSALILLVLGGFYFDLHLVSYLSIGIILFIATVLLNAYYGEQKPYKRDKSRK